MTKLDVSTNSDGSYNIAIGLGKVIFQIFDCSSYLFQLFLIQVANCLNLFHFLARPTRLLYNWM